MAMDKERRPTNVPVYLALCFFGLSGSLPTRALWIELPTLSRKLPEGKTLSLYLLIILESANLAALGYLVAKRFSRSRLSEIPVIYSCFALGLISLLLAGCFWDHTTPILGQPNSFALLLSSFLAAIVSCVSIVTYIPFTARLREPYITAFFLGEMLGSLLPHLLSVAQGITRKIKCIEVSLESSARASTSTPLFHNSSSFSSQSGAGKQAGQHSHYIGNIPRSTTTEIPAVYQLDVRFSEYAYFLICGSLLVVSISCFVLLRWCRMCQFEYNEPFIDHMDEVEVNPNHGEEFEDEVWQTTCDGLRMDTTSVHTNSPKIKDGVTRLPHDIITVHKANSSPIRIRPNSGGSASPIHLNVRRSRDSQQSRATSTGSEYTTGSIANNDAATGRPRAFPLLIVITFWTTAIMSGPLSTDKAYACFPSGNTSFLIGGLMCDVFVIITCIIAAGSTHKNHVTIVIALTCLGTILLTYLVALITFSHESESREQSPLYGNAGEMLAAIAWTAITALFSYARVTIGVQCRRSNPDALSWYAYATLFGMALGTLSMVGDVSICQVFRSQDITCH